MWGGRKTVLIFFDTFVKDYPLARAGILEISPYPVILRNPVRKMLSKTNIRYIIEVL